MKRKKVFLKKASYTNQDIYTVTKTINTLWCTVGSSISIAQVRKLITLSDTDVVISEE